MTYCTLTLHNGTLSRHPAGRTRLVRALVKMLHNTPNASFTMIPWDVMSSLTALAGIQVVRNL